MIYNKRPHWIVPVLQTGFVAGCAYSSTMIWANLQGSPLAAEIAASVGLGAASFSAMVFGVAWNGLTITHIGDDTPPETRTNQQEVHRGIITPKGWNEPPGFSNDSRVVPQADTSRVIIRLASGGGVFLTITREQLRYVAGLLKGGRYNIPVNIYGPDTPMERGDVERLRSELVKANLARATQSGRVVLTEPGRVAIMQAAALPY